MMAGRKSLMDAVALTVGGISVKFLSERALYIDEIRVLVLADLHFGKVNHFRRAGLPVPTSATSRNAERLISLIQELEPARTIFLGDLFHSAYNDDWEVVGQIVRHFPACTFDLVRGNHDVLSDLQYTRQGIHMLEQESLGNLLLTHEPLPGNQIPKGLVNVAGHIHPAASLVGKGRQSLRLPCFWLSEQQLVLPAFGSFTGLFAVYPREKDTVFVIADNRVMELKPSSLQSNQTPS